MPEIPRNGNGSKLAISILAGLLLASLAGMGGVIWAGNGLAEHERKAGHAQNVERVNALQRDVAEIKADVKTLLRRSGP